MLESFLLAAAVLVPPGAEGVVNKAMADVSRRYAMKPRVVGVQRVTWTDGSLGCPQPEMAYTQALVPGWRIELAAGSRSFLYHASEGGRVISCPPGQARKPLPDSKS